MERITVTARLLARLLIRALPGDLRFGDVIISVSDGEVTLIRQGIVYKGDELDHFTTELDQE